jgi:hypothetical protein
MRCIRCEAAAAKGQKNASTIYNDVVYSTVVEGQEKALCNLPYPVHIELHNIPSGALKEAFHGTKWLRGKSLYTTRITA